MVSRTPWQPENRYLTRLMRTSFAYQNFGRLTSGYRPRCVISSNPSASAASHRPESKQAMAVQAGSASSAARAEARWGESYARSQYLKTRPAAASRTSSVTATAEKRGGSSSVPA